MNLFFDYLEDWRHGALTPSLIDLGNGRQLAAEDILEGHYRRLVRPAARTANVQVQVGENLMAAITVLAPDLAPLTALAEGVAMAMPPVQPAPQFRRDLQRALELTHRQQRAQRRLGTRATPKTEERSTGQLALATLLLFTLLLFIWRRQHRVAA